MKLHIVLDIDNTLLVTSMGKKKFFTKGKKFEHMKTFMRPYVKVFLKTMFKYFDVSFWTTGECSYAKEMLERLEIDSIGKPKFILARDVVHAKDTTFMNLLTSKKYKLRNFDGNPIKHIDFLYTHKEFKCHPNTTVLIDDNPFFKALYPKNVMFIPRYGRQTQDDDVLWNVMLFMLENRNGSINDMWNKFPTFEKSANKKSKPIKGQVHNLKLSSGNKISKLPKSDDFRYVVNISNDKKSAKVYNPFTLQFGTVKLNNWTYIQ